MMEEWPNHPANKWYEHTLANSEASKPIVVYILLQPDVKRGTVKELTVVSLVGQMTFKICNDF